MLITAVEERTGEHTDAALQLLLSRGFLCEASCK
jgi:hypothetical protein